MKFLRLPYYWRLARRLWRWLQWVLLAGFVVGAVAVGVMRMFVLPNVDRFREPIAEAIGQSLGQRVSLGPITGGWAGFRPWLMIRDVAIHDDSGREALHLGRVQAIFGWSSLTSLQVRCRTLSIERLGLTVRRSSDGEITVGGIRVRPDEHAGGFSDWFLVQSHVVVSDADLTWIDEQRTGAPLELKDVQIQFRNRGRNHRFQLNARPAFEVGSAIDVRGEFRSGRTSGLRQWRGRIYLHAPYMNLAAARVWLDLPLRFESGAGNVEAWAEFAGGVLRSATFDLRVAGATARIDDSMPALDIPELQGRIGWLATNDGYEASARRLAFGIGDGQQLPPADVMVRHRYATPRAPARLQIESDRLDLAPVRYFLDRLPVPSALRESLASHRPAGRLVNLAFWIELPEGAPTRYSLNTGFEALSMAPAGPWPGVSGLAGTVTADQHGGSLRLDSGNTAFAAPLIFPDPLRFDQVRAQADWTLVEDGFDVTIRGASAFNSDAAGGASGTYRQRGDGSRRIDLQGSLVRADPAAVWKYVPRVAGEQTRSWLRSALRSGHIPRATVLLQGDLREFPFVQGDGRFEVAIDVRDGVLEFAPGWPPIQDIDGSIKFSANRMDIEAQGHILGARVTRASVVIPDLGSSDLTVQVKGEAEGPTAEFLRYLADSPVGELIGGVARGVGARGDGALKLALSIPIHRLGETAVAGTYTFTANRIENLSILPPLSRVQGALDFTDKGARVTGATAEVLGNPVRFNVLSQAGGTVRVDARGRIAVNRLAEQTDNPLLGLLRGETEVRAQAVARGDRLEITVDSDLKGLAIDLPAPVGKSMNETVAARLQTQTREDEVTATLSLGNRGSAVGAFGTQGGAPRLRRAAITFGGAPRLPSSPVISLEGTFPRIALEDWTRVMERLRAEDAVDTSAAPTLPLVLDLGSETLVAYGREFHDVRLRGSRRGEAWETTLTGREISGQVSWFPKGRGRLVARLDRLHVPESSAGVPSPSASAMEGADLPEFDVTAASFRLGGPDLGSLVLQAVPNGNAWQLRKLDLQNPDGRISAEGGWKSERGKPRTKLNVRAEARDLGKMLDRFGRSANIAGGTARATGTVEWEGTPPRVDLPSLSGFLQVEAHQGRFTQMEPGIGKLFSILSLQALPRRVTLDFRDVFSQGFAFDEILANWTLNHGVLRTSDFRMNGTSAKVAMMGELDLVRETQDLEVRVVPSVTDSLALGTAVVNPVVGLMALIVGKVLNNPLDQAIAFEYRITGTWAEPNVSKSKRSPVPGDFGGRR